MCEAQDGVAELEDVDEQTFIRFCEYAYTGDYTSAYHEIMLDSSMVGGENSVPEIVNPVPAPAERVSTALPANPPLGTVEEERDYPTVAEPVIDIEREYPTAADLVVDIDYDAESTAMVDNWGRYKKSKGKKKDTVACSNCGYLNDTRCMNCSHASVKVHHEPPPSQSQVLWDKFQSRHYPISTPDFKPRKNVEECEDYTEVFLSHARVYVFGDKYDIKKLRMLALHKLHRTLQVFRIYHKRVGDIAELIKYSYNNTRDIDDLRDLITHYVTCNFQDMATNDNFLALMEEGGPFVRDLAGLLLKRMG